jgi:nucleoside-diphosphate kinase
MKMTTLSTEILKTHYAHLVEKPFFPSIVAYMQSAPVVMIALT